ncbi:MAG: hypothetical protein ABIG66_02125 [Candidatus Kerfeldbacteria bacterium]
MGLEILPNFLFLAKAIVIAVGVITLFVIIAAMIEFYIHRGKKDKEEEMKGHVINGLIAVVIALIVYLLLSGIGPAFNALFR